MTQRATDTSPPTAGGEAAQSLPCLSFRWAEGELPAERAARFALLGSARTAVHAVVGVWGIDPLTAGSVGSVFYELSANAMEHGEPPIRIVVDCGFATGSVTVSVTDAAAALPVLAAAQQGARSRASGLEIVNEVAQVWDVTQAADGGKTVTAVVMRPEARPGRSGAGRSKKAGGPQVVSAPS